MNTYTIYRGNTAIATVEGTEVAYECYRIAKILADIMDDTASIVWDDSGEVIESYNTDDDDEYINDDWDDEDEYIEPDWDECGFDPYAGCYTGDC
jgi:hypothetical protein